MATNGIVTVTEKGEVIVKVITGCNGGKAMELAVALREVEQVDLLPPTVYRLAREFLGCSGCLVVMARVNGKIESLHECDDDLNHLYDLTFDCAFFNPRWTYGIASSVVKLEKTNGDIEFFEKLWKPVALLEPVNGDDWHEYWHSHNLNYDGDIVAGSYRISLRGGDGRPGLGVDVIHGDEYMVLEEIRTKGQLESLIKLLSGNE